MFHGEAENRAQTTRHPMDEIAGTGYDGVEAKPRTLTEQLQIQRSHLIKQLAEIEEAIRLIEQNPTVLRVMELVRRF